jgi:hypothetical protein
MLEAPRAGRVGAWPGSLGVIILHSVVVAWFLGVEGWSHARFVSTFSKL